MFHGRPLGQQTIGSRNGDGDGFLIDPSDISRTQNPPLSARRQPILRMDAVRNSQKMSGQRICSADSFVPKKTDGFACPQLDRMVTEHNKMCECLVHLCLVQRLKHRVTINQWKVQSGTSGAVPTKLMLNSFKQHPSKQQGSHQFKLKVGPLSHCLI